MLHNMNRLNIFPLAEVNMKIIVKTDKVKEAKEKCRILCRLPKGKVKQSEKLYDRQKSKKVPDGFFILSFPDARLFF